MVNKPLASNEPFFLFDPGPLDSGRYFHMYTLVSKYHLVFILNLQSEAVWVMLDHWKVLLFFLFHIHKIPWNCIKMAIAWIKLSQCFLVLKCNNVTIIFPRKWPIVKKEKKRKEKKERKHSTPTKYMQNCLLKKNEKV